jgi:predicted transcriptional regulator
MAIPVSADLERRLREHAEAEGLSVDAFLERIMDQREALSVIADTGESQSLSSEQIRLKIERGLAQSSRGEVFDGEQTVRELLSDLESLEQDSRGT